MPVLVTFLFYLPILGNDFVNWDDTEAIVQNLHIHRFDMDSLHWMFTTFYTGNWMPLTWLSLAMDYHLGRLNPRIYHLDNLLLHSLNTLLVFWLSLKVLGSLIRDEGKRKGILPTALLAAGLFGVHPLHVESVAWATERKDVLCGAFYLSALLVYWDYVASFKRARYFLCLSLFLLALMAKPMAVTLPLVLLLLDAGPLKRRNFIEKIPFFFLALGEGILTLFAQSQSAALEATDKLSLGFRLMNAFHSVILYLLKTIIPIGMASYYPLPFARDIFSAPYLASVVLVILLSWICLRDRHERPYLMWVWSIYLVMLAPVLGVLQVGSQAAADRYMYLPSVGILLLFSAMVMNVIQHSKIARFSIGSILFLSFGFLTWGQAATWKDSVTIWERVVQVSPGVSEIAYGNLGNAYRDAHRLEEALAAYDQAIAIGPPHAYPHDGKGTALLQLGRIQEAVVEFKNAIALDTHYASPHRNLWFAYERSGDHASALAEIQEAVRIDPDYADAYNNLGISYGYGGRYSESLEAFQKALSLDPGNVQYLVNLATTCQRAGKYDEAIDLYRGLIQRDPGRPLYFLNLGNTYLLKGMVLEAVQALEQAAALVPNDTGVYEKLAEAYLRSGQPAKAQECYRKIKSLRSAQ